MPQERAELILDISTDESCSAVAMCEHFIHP